MPGLLRGVARTAVVAGTASAVAGRVNRRQQQRWAAQDDQAAQQEYAQQQYAAPAPQYAPPPAAPAPAAGRDPIDALKELAALHSQGVLTDAEFATEKAKILGS
ncbi:MAG: SHOCT domain-containing protein [Actinomycetota bacterium]|nr:MAG: SHOCT domain-containing protein [Actinomycetota bacterium]